MYRKASPKSAVDLEGRTTRIADAHRDDGQRFVARANERIAP
jgi:hypothetical protein